MNNADKPIYPTLMQQVGDNEFEPTNLHPKSQHRFVPEYSIMTGGLTKREYFSVLAMQGLLANPQYWKRVYKDISTLKSDKDSIECVFAHYSIKIAEELLEQLEGK